MSNSINVFLLFYYYLSLGKSMAPHLNKPNWASGSGEEDQNVTGLQTADNGQKAIRKAHLTLSAQVS